MRAVVAVIICLGAAVVAALYAWRVHHLYYLEANLVAFAWLVTALWLGGRLDVFTRSPRGIYRGFRGAPPLTALPKFIFTGSVALGLASLLLLFR